MKLTILTLTLMTMTGGLFAGEVDKRLHHEQGNIVNGVNSGALTPRETGRLETREANVAREIRTDRRANGGKLTGAERAKVNRQENRLSQSIHRDKHN